MFSPMPRESRKGESRERREEKKKGTRKERSKSEKKCRRNVTRALAESRDGTSRVSEETGGLKNEYGKRKRVGKKKSKERRLGVVVSLRV